MKSKVFICHSTKDHDFVDFLAKKLTSDNIDVWFSDWEIKAGDSITEKVNKGLEKSSFFILVLSNDSVKSNWVNRELNSTLMRFINQQDVKILPVLLDIEVSQLPPLIKDFYAVKFTRKKLDNKEYKKLIAPIMEDKKSEILKNYQDVFLETVEHIDLILNKQKPTLHEVEFISRVIKDESYNNYFFKKVNSLQWFDILDAENYFSDNEKLRNLLPYLERISQHVSIEGNEKYTPGLLNIIKNITSKSDEQSDNYYMYWFFIKILLNIPNDKITSYLKNNKIKIDQDWLLIWMGAKLKHGLVETDIAKKLLPKFLTEKKEDIEIAERIIDIITRIEWEPLTEERRRLHRKDAEPKTIVDPYWLIESFKNNAEKVGKLCNRQVILRLADKLKDIFKGEHKDHQVFTDDNKYRITVEMDMDKEFIFKVRAEELKKEELDALKPENQYFGILSIKGEVIGGPFSFEARDKNTFIKEAKEKLKSVEEIKFAIVAGNIDIDEKLDNIYNGLYSDYSHIWYKSLASFPDVGTHEANVVLIFILKEILLAKCKYDKEAGEDILDKFLGEEYQFPLFRRLVLFMADNLWDDYKGRFWKFISENHEVFDDSDYELELYKLLQSHIDKFESEQKNLLREIINEGPRWKPDKKEEQEYYIANWRQRWYSAMQKDAEFLKLYEEQKEITGVQKVEPPSEEFGAMFVGPGPSPIPKEKILQLSNLELVQYLSEFKEKDRWKDPTERGLAEELRLAVEESPSKFSNAIVPFLKVNYLYAYNVLYGFVNAWKNKKVFAWDKVFAFCKAYINKPDFWKEAKEAQGEDWAKGSHTWVINVISDLIQEGTRDDAWAFSKDYFPVAEEVLDIILKEMLQKTPPKKEKTHRDYVTEALNTSYGHITTAMILLSLRKARVDIKEALKDKDEVKWNPDKYEILFNNNVIEAYTLFGRYMPNLSYLNKPWVEKKIKEFDEKFKVDDVEWRAFIEGYLFGPRVYTDLYKLMRSHCEKAIGVDFEEGHDEGRLVQYVTIAYLRDIESLNGKDSLFKKIIDRWKFSMLHEIVSFLWSEARHVVDKLREKEDTDENLKEIKDKIIKFWKWVYDNRKTIQNKLNDNYKVFLSDLSRLTVILDGIDEENSKWILETVLYLETNFNSSFLIEYLDKFDGESNMGFISDIMLEILKHITPDFQKEHIISIVRKIYSIKALKSKADEICNIYGKKGYEFLRPLWEEANRKK